MSAPSEAAEISIDGLTFGGADEKPEAGEATAETVFEYHERDGIIWARYEGGPVRLGFLVGTRDGDKLEFRYSQVNDKGETSNGRCSSTVSVLSDGPRPARPRLGMGVETWRRPGHTRGTAVMR
jgi:hypothetical protein